MNMVIKNPFGGLQVGEEYFYNREGFARPSRVKVEEEGGKRFINFYEAVSPFRISVIPVDAEFTPAI